MTGLAWLLTHRIWYYSILAIANCYRTARVRAPSSWTWKGRRCLVGTVFLFGFICSCLSQLDLATSLPLAVPSAVVGANAVPCDLPTNQDQIPFLSLLARVTFLILTVCQCTKRQRLILSVFFRSPLPQLQPKFSQGVIELYDDSAFVPASISTASALSLSLSQIPWNPVLFEAQLSRPEPLNIEAQLHRGSVAQGSGSGPASIAPSLDKLPSTATKRRRVIWKPTQAPDHPNLSSMQGGNMSWKKWYIKLPLAMRSPMQGVWAYRGM